MTVLAITNMATQFFLLDIIVLPVHALATLFALAVW